jgi:hypothetical protein
VLSVTSDVSVGAPLQAVAPKLSSLDPALANDSFAALVDSNLPASPSIQPAREPEPPAAQGPPAEAPADNRSAADPASSQAQSNTRYDPSANRTSQPVDDTGPVATGTDGSTAARPQGGTKPATSKPANTKSTDALPASEPRVRRSHLQRKWPPRSLSPLSKRSPATRQRAPPIPPSRSRSPRQPSPRAHRRQPR